MGGTRSGSERNTSLRRGAAAALCVGVLAIFALLATQAHELTSMYGGFRAWLGLLLPVGALGGALAVALAYGGSKLAGVSDHRRALPVATFLVSLAMSLLGGFLGALQHDPVQRRLDAERTQAEDCEKDGGIYRSHDDSCSFPGVTSPRSSERAAWTSPDCGPPLTANRRPPPDSGDRRRRP